MLKRAFVFVLLGSILASYIVFDLGQYLSLEYMQASRDRLQEIYESRTALVLCLYFLVYVLVTALALPAATVLSLVGGALFGLTIGTVLVSFASTIGASIAFLLSRYLLRDWVQRRFGDKIARINEGMERDGAFYLFSLRLIPLFPFFVINMVMGLTPLRLRTYYWVSQLGMFPATIVYINAGKELGQIESLSGLLSPSLIFSFALLGLFPLIFRKILQWYQARRDRHASL